MRVPQMCVGKSDGSITNFKYRGPQMAVEAGVPVGGVCERRGCSECQAEIEITGPGLSIARISEMLSALRSLRPLPPAKARAEEGLVLGPDFERRLTAGARADYLPDAFSFPGGEGARPFGLGLECQIMGWRHGAVDVRNTRTKTCGRAPTLRHRGSTIH